MYKRQPREVPSIVNHRVINRRHVVVGVSGGVTVNVANVVRDMKLLVDDGKVASAKSSAKRDVPNVDSSWWWD